MTFSATSPGSGFHGEDMLRKVNVGPVFRSVEVGASRCGWKKSTETTANWKEMETRERLIEGEAVPRKESTNDDARWRYQVGEESILAPGEEVGLTRAESGRSKGGELELKVEVGSSLAQLKRAQDL